MKIMYLVPFLFALACHDPQPAHVDKGVDMVAMTPDNEAAYNMNVLQKLVAAGDSMAKPRLVRHWIYFKDTADRRQYQVFAVANKYNVESTGTDSTGDYIYELCISKVSDVQLQTINAATHQLKQAAAKYNGNYDGWETEVVH